MNFIVRDPLAKNDDELESKIDEQSYAYSFECQNLKNDFLKCDVDGDIFVGEVDHGCVDDRKSATWILNDVKTSL